MCPSCFKLFPLNKTKEEKEEEEEEEEEEESPGKHTHTTFCPPLCLAVERPPATFAALSPCFSPSPSLPPQAILPAPAFEEAWMYSGEEEGGGGREGRRRNGYGPSISNTPAALCQVPPPHSLQHVAASPPAAQ